MASGTWESPVPMLCVPALPLPLPWLVPPLLPRACARLPCPRPAAWESTRMRETPLSLCVEAGGPASRYRHARHAPSHPQGGLKHRLPGPLADAAYDLIFGIDNAKLIRARPRYNTSNFPFLNGSFALSNVLTDYWFRCSTEQFASAATRGGKAAWFYRFDHRAFSAPRRTALSFTVPSAVPCLAVFSKAYLLPGAHLPAVCGYLGAS